MNSRRQTSVNRDYEKTFVTSTVAVFFQSSGLQKKNKRIKEIACVRDNATNNCATLTLQTDR